MKSELIIKGLLSSLYESRKSFTFRRKAVKLLQELKRNGLFTSAPENVINEHKKLWSDFSGGNNSVWLKIYGAVSKNWDPKYVSEIVYYNNIEPRLNNKVFSKAYTDKNIYDRILTGVNMPATILRRINGSFYSSGYNLILPADAFKILIDAGSFISKPSVDSGGGRDVMKWISGESFLTSGHVKLKLAEELPAFFPPNCLFQEVIRQNSFYSSFNESSVNTIRVLTYRSVLNEEPVIINAVFRVGRNGMLTDNQASGGYACGADTNGRLTGMAVDKTGNRHFTVNELTLEKGALLPYFDQVKEAAIKVASQYKYSRLLGLDFCINSENKPVLIEINDQNNEINFYQMNGFPLFGEYTQEIISHCKASPKSFILDYEI